MATPSTLTRRFRAREDGEKPSPPRDCKAGEFFAACHCPARNRNRLLAGWEGRVAAPMVGNPPSQETDGVSIPVRLFIACAPRIAFNSRARGRGGRYETPFFPFTSHHVPTVVSFLHFCTNAWRAPWK